MFSCPITLRADRRDGGFVVTFVDIPEAITQGNTVEEALAAGKDALDTALDFYLDDKRAVPPPSKVRRGGSIYGAANSGALQASVVGLDTV